MLKMIAMDLDGTLLTKDKNISAYALEILSKCRGQGVMLVVATARSEIAATKYVEILKPDATIFNCGSVAKGEKGIIFEEQIPVDICRDLINVCTEKYNLKNTKIVTRFGDFSNAPNISGDDFEYIFDDYNNLMEGAYKITIKADLPVAQQVAEHFESCSMIRFEGRNSFMFTHVNATKEIAIQKVASHFGVNMNEIVAFGDDLTDIKILHACEIGVAVSNALPEVKEVANFICGSNNDDGVANWIDSHMDLFSE